MQRRVVGGRDDAADDDHDVGAVELGQLGAQLGHQREVPGGQRVDADDVHVGLDGLARDLARGLEQRADVDVEAEVGERGGDHLLAAVVAVLAHLGDEDAGLAALLLGELGRPARGRGRSPGCCPASSEYTPEMIRIWPAWRPNTFSSASEISPTVALRPGRVDRRARAGSASSRALRALGDRGGGVRERRQRVVDGRGRRAPRAAGAASPAARRARRRCRPCGRRSPRRPVDDVLVDPDHRLAAGVDARLGAGRGLLDPQLRDAGVDRLRHAAGLLDLLRCAPTPGGRGRR